MHSDLVAEIHNIELSSQKKVLEAWDRWTGLAMSSLYSSNTISKRIIYTLKPHIYEAPWSNQFKISGINTRLYLASDNGHSNHSTRFEAISHLPFNGFTSYYALGIQYRQDAEGQMWQVIQPSVLLAKNVCTMLSSMSNETKRKIVRNLRLLLNIASHDYIHSTIMQWFESPKLEASAAYKQMIFEDGPPVELIDWHKRLAQSTHVLLCSGEVKKIRDILEYQAVYSHRKTLQELIKGNAVHLTMVKDLTTQIGDILSEVEIVWSDEVNHMRQVLGSMLLSMFSLENLSSYLPTWGVQGIDEKLLHFISKDLFCGFYDVMEQLDDNSFQWGDDFENIRVPFCDYAKGLNDFIQRKQACAVRMNA